MGRHCRIRLFMRQDEKAQQQGNAKDAKGTKSAKKEDLREDVGRSVLRPTEAYRPKGAARCAPTLQSRFIFMTESSCSETIIPMFLAPQQRQISLSHDPARRAAPR
jgi:hypothetical protein